MRKVTYALSGAVALGLLAMAPAFAEDAHHPAGSGAPAAAATAQQTQAQPGQGMPMGMMGGGMGGMTMCPMMGQGGLMADMASHIDGHVAFLKAELKITPAQEDVWKGFAGALRTSASAMAQMPGMPMGMGGGAQSVAQSFEQKERLLTTRLDNTKRLRAAWTKLEAALTPEQRKAAEQVVAPRLTMM